MKCCGTSDQLKFVAGIAAVAAQSRSMMLLVVEVSVALTVPRASGRQFEGPY